MTRHILTSAIACAVGWTALAVTSALAQTPQSAGSTSPHEAHVQMNTRGNQGMGFDQAATTHHFYLREDGGVIEVTVKDPKDKTNLTGIRAHLPDVMKLFAAGNFSTPDFVHDESVPGTEEMKRLRDRIAYAYQDVPNGGRINIKTRHARALSAVHEFLRYQITEHHTGDPMQVTRIR